MSYILITHFRVEGPVHNIPLFFHQKRWFLIKMLPFFQLCHLNQSPEFTLLADAKLAAFKSNFMCRSMVETQDALN